MDAIRYEEKFAEQWDEFVWKANNGTIFHSRKFLSYHPPHRFEDHSLIFLKKNKWIAVFPAVVKYENNEKILISHRGASYGGFVTGQNLGVKDFVILVDTLIDYSLRRSFSIIEVTLPPLIYLEKPCNYLDFALVRRGFFYKKREISSVIPLDFSPDDILVTFKNEARTAVRRAIKLGVQIRESQDFDSFYEILKKNLKMRHNVAPTHSLQELLKLKKLFPEHIRLFAAYLADKMIAGVVLFICNQRVALAFYISHNEDYQRYRAVNLLFFEIIKWTIENDFKFLDFGIFTVNMEPNWGLGKFKENFGAKGIFRDTFEKRLNSSK